MKLTKEETNDLINCLEDAIEKKGKSFKTKDRLALERLTALYFKVIRNYLWERESVR
jgi:hypothetical protein